MATTKVKTICFECHSRCGLVLEVEGGRVTAVSE